MLRTYRWRSAAVLTLLCVAAATQLVCSLPPLDLFPIEYVADCPASRVVLPYEDYETWIVVDADGEEEELDVCEYSAKISFDSCDAQLNGTVIIRGTENPGGSLRLWMICDDIRLTSEGVPETTYDHEGPLHAYTLPATGSDWAVEYPSFMYTDTDTSMNNGKYSVFIEASESACDSFGEISVEFQYQCDCCPYNTTDDKTYDYGGLDLRFGDPPLTTSPEKPQHLTEFLVKWTTCYDMDECMDDASESSNFTATYVITRGGVVVDSNTVTVSSVRMSDCEAFSFTHPGLEIGTGYAIDVELDPGDSVCECIIAGHEDNNRAAYQFEVECSCAPDRGDLAIEELLVPKIVAEGQEPSVSWEICYKKMCGSEDGDTGPFTERVLITDTIDGSWSRISEFEVATIALGECELRSWTLPGDIPPGDYILVVDLDYTGSVEECHAAVEENWDWLTFTVEPNDG